MSGPLELEPQSSNGASSVKVAGEGYSGQEQDRDAGGLKPDRFFSSQSRLAKLDPQSPTSAIPAGPQRSLFA